jgi:hypothetical protein
MRARIRKLCMAPAFLLVWGCSSSNDATLFIDGGSGSGNAATGGVSGSGGSAGNGTGGTAGSSGGSAGVSTGGAGGVAGAAAAAGASGGGGAATGGSSGTGGSPCGNGAVDPGEQCDGANLAGHSCATVVGPKASGQLGCSEQCSFDTSKCCLPSCGGKSCGPDGCGGECGTCSSNQVCQTGQCVCVPSCSGKQCGSDGCGGVCGTCQTGTSCSNGQCVCAKQCSGKTCGPDGCGGTCGTCSATQYCYNQSICISCTTECLPSTSTTAGSSQNCYAWHQANSCTYCNSTCGLSGHMYTCGGTGAPPLSSCQKLTAAGATDSSYCCPQATCVRYTNGDAYCVQNGKPPKGYSCAPGASPPASCVKQTYGSTEWFCCP